MAAKMYDHRVTISEKRRNNKRKNDLVSKGSSKKDAQQIFDLYYKDQVRALYRAVTDFK